MNKVFNHQSLHLKDKKSIVFTAISKKYFYMRMFINKFVLENNKVPINPFMSFDYYLADLVDRDLVRNANNNLVDKADELWVFGSISNGVLAEIKQFKELKRPIKYFSIQNDKDIREITTKDLIFEPDAEDYRDLL